MKEKTMVFMLILILLVVINCVAVSALNAPPVPSLMDVNVAGAEGDWYVGATPPNCDLTKPVIVFIQGLGGNASNWWGTTPYNYYGDNDMYAYAYNSGYRTAFVNFTDADGVTGSMWRNGAILRNQLTSICSYFGVKKVNLVCHSKGGIDAQSAIVHYGACSFVDKVFTLSTPHWGSPLADLSFSWYGWPLGELMNSHDDGTYVLQTGYMNYFRSITDNRQENNSITYYTSAGTNWGPVLSELWLQGAYLSLFGSNDGQVTVQSAHNPRATHITTSNLNHDNIRFGSKSWGYIEPLLGKYSSGAMASQSPQLATSSMSVTATDATEDTSNNCVFRGGQIQKTETVTVPIDSSTTAVTFDLMVADPTVNVKVVAPDGTEYTPSLGGKDTQYFSGATHLITNVNSPKCGYWNIKMDSEKSNAYLLITSFDSLLEADLVSDKSFAQEGQSVALDVNVKGSLNKKLKNSSTSAFLCKVINRGKVNKVQEFTFDSVNDKVKKDVKMPLESGLYNFNISIKGTLDDGSPFERTIVKSIVVESGSKTGVENLKSLTK